MRGFCLEVGGPFACFTRPEMKVERVSYDVITPSAARAIYDAILWKPAISWEIKRIEVMAPIRWVSVRRNEVGKVASPRSDGIFIEDERQQRAGLFLRDVKYRIYGEFRIVPAEERPRVFNPVPKPILDEESSAAAGKEGEPAKFAAMFERRAKKGQCFNQPYLGCREFSASFRLVDPSQEAAAPIDETRDLGWMLYDLDFSDPADPRPLFFHALLDKGVVDTDRGHVEVRR